MNQSEHLRPIMQCTTSDTVARKREKSEQLISHFLVSEFKKSKQPFNFADAEWVAVEARALGLLATHDDAVLLVELMAEITSLPKSVCFDEVMPVLQYRERLDTGSVLRLKKLIDKRGRSAVAKDIGISKPTLEKLASGGWRGPLFRHLEVSRTVIDKARAFLST